MLQIPVTSIPNIQIGQAQDAAAATGCTVILCPAGAAAGPDVRGGGPASRAPAPPRLCSTRSTSSPRRSS